MERLNRWLALIANFGVAIGIVFLVYEMRLNTEAMRSGTAAQMVTNWNAITMDLATNPDLIDAVVQVQQRGVALAEEAPILFNSAGALASSMYKASEYMFIEYQNGNVDEEVWVGQLNGNRTFISNQAFMLIFWGLARWQVAPSFREFMDGMVRDICAAQMCPVGGRPEDWPQMGGVL